MSSNYQSLLDRISARQPLSETEIESAVTIFGARCQPRKVYALRAALKNVPEIPSFGIYHRVHFENGQASYCAGQSYPDEIRTVRKLLAGF
jgi:hypothetical protein